MAMAAKKQDSNVVTERRLKPIYDCLDIGNNKMALQEAEKLLKKQPDLVCAKALRALALIRLGRSVEAMIVLGEIERQDPDEEYTLQALTYCYRDLGKPENIITLYERATKKHPQNEEFLSHLMMAYVRIGEHKRQHHIAMQLYKLRPAKNPYYFWSVMSTVMQAYDDPKLARTMYLPLAERMIKKFIETDKLNAEAEVKLYVLILEMQEKYAEAVAVLQGDLTARFVKCMWESNQKIIELLEKLQRFQEIYDLCETGLAKSPDDWFLWSHLISSGFELIKVDSSKKLEIIDKLTNTVLSKLESDEMSKEGGPCRGPYLARLHLITCLLEKDYVVRSELGTSLLGEPSELLLKYFRIFGDKPSLFDDLKPYLWLLGEEQQNSFIDHLVSICDDLSMGTQSSQGEIVFVQNVKEMMRHQSALQLTRCLGRHAGLSVNEKQSLVLDLIRRYEAALAFGADLLPTEMQHADGYLLLALHTMWDVYTESGDMQFIFEMLVLGEKGLKRSPSNFRLKSLLIKLYSLVGGGQNMLRLCESMDVKYVLRDSLGYLVCDQLTPWGLYADLIEWTKSSLTFYAQSEKEIVDCVVQCYKSGSFPKIVEFFDFRKRLRNSFHFHACQVWGNYFSVINDGACIDMVISILKETAGVDVLNSSSKWLTYNDNSDYAVNPCWDPDETLKAAEMKRQEFRQQQMDQLRFYQLVLALLSLLPANESPTCCPGHVQETTAPVENDASNGVGSTKESDWTIDETFLTILSELRAHCKHCANSSSATGSFSSPILNSPVSGYFGIYLTGNYVEVLAVAMESVFKFVKAAVTKNGMATNGDKVEVQMQLPPDEEVVQLLKTMFSSHQLQGNGFPFMQMCHVSLLVQTLSIILAAINLAIRRVRAMQQHQHPSSAKDKKQKKKKGQSSTSEVPEDSLTTDFIQFASTFCQAGETTLRLIEDLGILLDTDMSLCVLNDTKLVPADFCAVKSETISGLRASYKHSIKELQRVMSENLVAVGFWSREKDTAKRLP